MTKYEIRRFRGWRNDKWTYYYKVYHKTDINTNIVGLCFVLLSLGVPVWANFVYDPSLVTLTFMSVVSVYLFIQGLTAIHNGIGDYCITEFASKRLAQKYIDGLDSNEF